MENIKEAAQIFARTISKMLDDGEGILIRPGKSEEGVFDSGDNLLVVANSNQQIIIVPLSELVESTEGFEEGQYLKVEEE